MYHSRVLPCTEEEIERHWLDAVTASGSIQDADIQEKVLRWLEKERGIEERDILACFDLPTIDLLVESMRKMEEEEQANRGTHYRSIPDRLSQRFNQQSYS